MFPGLQRFNRLLHVPVVRGDNTNDIDVISLEHLAVVLIAVCFAFANFGIVDGLVDVFLINITTGDDITKLDVLVSIAPPHTT